jgi:RNA polymerase sigma-70 factor (ECF subfamily)
MSSTEQNEVLEQLVRQYGGRMLAAARRILRDDEEAARDAVQDAFLSVHLSLARFRADASVGTWLHRIAVNAALMRRRSRQRRRETPIEDLLPSFAGDGRHAGMPTPVPQPDRAIEQVQMRAAVRAAIDQLPDTYRTVIVLRDLEELSTEETADALDISPNAVKVRLHRARRALLALLQRTEGAERTAGLPVYPAAPQVAL